MAKGKGTQGLNPELAAKVIALINASKGRVWIVSGYRSVERQQQLWNAAVKKYGAKEARKWVAPPGKSNHNHGLAVDLGGDLKLVAKLAPQFGLRRPMKHEPWHWELANGPRNKDAYTRAPDDHDHADPTTQTQTEPAADPNAHLRTVEAQMANFMNVLVSPPQPEASTASLLGDEF